MIKKGEKNQTDSFSPTRVKPIIPATHFLLLSLMSKNVINNIFTCFPKRYMI